MDLSKHNLLKCIEFIENEGYNIIIKEYGIKNNHILLYFAHFSDNDGTVYNKYYTCYMQKFDTIDDLIIQLNIDNYEYTTLAIGIFYKNINKAKKYINNKDSLYFIEYNTFLEKGYKTIKQD